MNYVIENEDARLEVNTWACEIASFKRKDKKFEYMWQGDKNYWAGRNPILFPHVSAPKNKVLNFGGKDCVVGNHGFLRRSEFKFESKTEDTLVFSFKSNVDTLKEYPYKFKMTVTYRLVGSKVTITYSILNNDDKDMPFGFGLHPAFSCPIDPYKKFNDYRLVFNNEEEGITDHTLPINRELFKKYPTYLINECKSDSVTLTDGTNGVKVDFTGFNKCAFWTCEKAAANYLCIEPWLMQIDPEDITTPFEKRPGVRFIKPGAVFEINYSIEII